MCVCVLESMCITFFLLRDLFSTCFASFYYLVIHSILFHYIHAFIWISYAPLIILNHLYVSRVKLSSFLYPLSIMTKRGRNCGEYVVSFLSLYTCFLLFVCNLLFPFHIKMHWWVCLKCFKNTSCQSLLAINSLLAKFFKSLC